MIRDKLFRKVTGISDEDVIVELEKMASVQSLRKGEMYIHRGEPEMQVAFLLSGGIKTFLTNGSGPHAPALMNIQTIADTEILKVPMDLVWRLREENPQVASVYDTWLLRYLQEHQEHKQVLCLPTEDRLRWLAEKRPDLVRIASQKDIALFLNMTPERLSTVKKQLLEAPAFCEKHKL